MAASILDALVAPDRASIPALVDALREIQEGRAASTPRAPGGAGPVADARPSLSRLVIEGLMRGSEYPSRPTTPQDPPPTADRPETALYGAIRAGLERLEREAQRHAEAVDRLLDRDPSPARAAPYQETLYLQCGSRGRTAGRFRCVNRRATRTAVASILRPFTINREPLKAAPTLTLRPGTFFLDAGHSQVIVVEADLASCSGLACGILETSIDLLMNDAVALKLWIEINVHERD